MLTFYLLIIVQPFVAQFTSIPCLSFMTVHVSSEIPWVFTLISTVSFLAFKFSQNVHSYVSLIHQHFCNFFDILSSGALTQLGEPYGGSSTGFQRKALVTIHTSEFIDLIAMLIQVSP